MLNHPPRRPCEEDNRPVGLIMYEEVSVVYVRERCFSSRKLANRQEKANDNEEKRCLNEALNNQTGDKGEL